MAAPLLVNNVMAGALTFDFAAFSKKYAGYVETLKSLGEDAKIEISELGEQNNEEGGEWKEAVRYMEKMFETAVSARNIAVNLLGQYGNLDYGKLYEEEWINDDKI